ncbi:amidohydrolase/deacetylase family metallohydrolase [Peribacillus simplex]|uniref:amidohydrolase/deacetylase family metallohydrolase n=1 Tax=Peribacillus simplex TaxID=1478 RepID=UPI0016272CB6|nr:amidohydrolase/deacetylase family metallohydrolase [Peribacillus simplex]
MVEAIIIKNGYVVDPEVTKIQKRDIGMLNGKFIDPAIVESYGADVIYIDANGSYVAPGFIDIHTHVFKDYTSLGIEADKVGVNQGVTTIIDAGSAGLDNYETFKQKVIKTSKTEVLAFLNISTKGLCNGGGELSNPNDLMPSAEARSIFRTEPPLVGLKARMSGSVVGNNGLNPLLHARKLADDLHVPIMVHIGNPPPLIEEILPMLRKGDIVTHAFHGKTKNKIITEHQKLTLEAINCLNRGVLFDVGHGAASFSFKTLSIYKEKYHYPFSISSDLHVRNYESPVGSLMQTMSKVRGLGYSLLEVVAAVTMEPAKTLHLTEQGTFAFGTRADVTLFYETDVCMDLIDSEGETIMVEKVIEPYLTIREGKKVYESNVGTKPQRS